jgi:hypothetical protein
VSVFDLETGAWWPATRQDVRDLVTLEKIVLDNHLA